MDAQVAYGFHHLRNDKPYLAQGPISNKVNTLVRFFDKNTPTQYIFKIIIYYFCYFVISYVVIVNLLWI